LNGHELISKKVKRLVSMAGNFPQGREFNIYIDSTSSEYVLNEWPGEINIHRIRKLVINTLQASGWLTQTLKIVRKRCFQDQPTTFRGRIKKEE